MAQTATHTAPAKAPRTHQSRVEFHMGEALIRVASDYPTVLDVILEQIQNALDAEASYILVLLDRKKRRVAIRDNGEGVSQEDFEQALQQVCHSQKTAGKLGRFGIGLISPLGKCRSFTFTSSSRKGSGEYMQWTFDTEGIRQQTQEVNIPRCGRSDLVFAHQPGGAVRRGLTPVLWRTEVNIHSYSADKMISRISSIDDLVDAVLDRFSAVMRRNNVALTVKFVDEDGNEEKRENVRAELFTGRRLKEVKITEADAGTVLFRLFLAPKTTKGQNGKVIVGEMDNDYRFPFSLMARSAGDLLSATSISALTSGVFEGEILVEKVTLTSTRRSFEHDDAFVGLCIAIESWFKDHGADYLEEIQDARRDQRYQELGLASLREIEDMLRQPSFKEIRDVLQGFVFGSVGSGHAKRPKSSIVGEQPERSLSTHEGLAPKGSDSDSEHEHDEPSNDLPAHEPYTVAGPQGRQRTIVKRDSMGLQFSYVAMDGSDRLWELDVKHGILHFNVNHPVWVACDVSDRKVRQLQETVAIFALMLETMPDETKDGLRYMVDETMSPLTYVFHSSSAFNLRRTSPAKK